MPLCYLDKVAVVYNFNLSSPGDKVTPLSLLRSQHAAYFKLGESSRGGGGFSVKKTKKRVFTAAIYYMMLILDNLASILTFMLVKISIGKGYCLKFKF